jgi:hypothetical protein
MCRQGSERGFCSLGDECSLLPGVALMEQKIPSSSSFLHTSLGDCPARLHDLQPALSCLANLSQNAEGMVKSMPALPLGTQMDQETWIWAGGMAQVVECLTSKCEAQNSNPSTAKIKNKKTEFFLYIMG